MKRLAILRCLLFCCLAIPTATRAATVTGTLLSITGAAHPDKKIVFTPVDTPRFLSNGSVLWSPTQITSVDGVFTVTLGQGHYRVSIDGIVWAYRCIPAGSSTYDFNNASLTCGTGTAIFLDESLVNKVKTDSDDGLAGYLYSELSAGTNIVLEVVDDGSGTNNVVKINGSPSDDHLVFASGFDETAGTLVDKVIAGTGVTIGVDGDTDDQLTIGLTATGTAGTYGDATHFPIITTDASGRVSAVTTQSAPAQNWSTANTGYLQPSDDTLRTMIDLGLIVGTNTTSLYTATTNDVFTAYSPYARTLKLYSTNALQSGSVLIGSSPASFSSGITLASVSTNSTLPSTSFQLTTTRGTANLIMNDSTAGRSVLRFQPFGAVASAQTNHLLDTSLYETNLATRLVNVANGSTNVASIDTLGRFSIQGLTNLIGDNGTTITYNGNAIAGGVAGTLINSAATVAGNLVKFTDTTKTNTAPASSADIQAALGNVYQGTNTILATISSISPAAPQTITFSTTLGVTQWLVATGNVTIASASLSAAAGFTLHIDNQQATNINVITPIGWHPVSGAGVSGTTIGTNILAAGKIGILSGLSRAANDTNVVSLWASE